MFEPLFRFYASAGHSHQDSETTVNMPKILNPKLLPGSSPQFVLALQSPLYQAAHASTSRPLYEESGSKPTTRSHAKPVAVWDIDRFGASRAPTGPVRGMRGAFANRATAIDFIRTGVGSSDWVNVSISVETPACPQMHNVPIEVREVACVPLQEAVREVKQEIEVEAPFCTEPIKKRAREREVEENLLPGHANSRARVELQTRRQFPDASNSEQLVEDVGTAQNCTEPSGTDECALGSRNERHVRFLKCITLVLKESSGFLKKSTESESFQPSYDELRTFQCNAKDLLDEVEQGIHRFRVKELQRKDAEKAKAESELVSTIESLKLENANVRATCTRLEREVYRLSQEKAEAEKKRLEAESDKVKHVQEETKELAKKHEEAVDALGREFVALRGKAVCQMCHANPRDGLILPCLHLLYCYQCLEKHKSESKECPWASCRGRINALLQCNLIGERSPG